MFFSGSRYSRIERLHNEYAQDGYVQAARNPLLYPLSERVPAFMGRNGLHEKGYAVIDLGCGPGNLKDYTQFASYEGVDLSQEMVRLAKGSGYAKVTRSDVLSCVRTLPDRSYDAAFSLSVTYFLTPDELEELVGHLRRIVRDYWVITLDGVYDNIISTFAKERKIGLYNHVGAVLPGVIDREIIEGWPSPVDGRNVPMELVAGRKGR